MNIADIALAMNRKTSKKTTALSKSSILHTGSTLLNLACSGKAAGGFLKGKYFFLVGDSASGKTWLSLTCLAEASINRNFDGYRFIYDNGEDGALMDFAKYFGQAVKDRIEAPATGEDGEPLHSETVEDFYYNLDDALKEGTPFIYILDSENSLTSDAEGDKFEEQKAARRAGKDTAGSYGDNKAKIHSQNLRKLMRPLSRTGSILIILSQTRDNLGVGFEKKTRSGGKALRFYACLEIWSSLKGKLKKTVRGKPRQIGVDVLLHIKKNRLTGKDRQVIVPIYHSYGIDDIGSCIDYLVSEKHWAKRGATINAVEFDLKVTKEKLIAYLEDNEMEKDLRMIVQSVWDEIESGCEVKRKRKYE